METVLKRLKAVLQINRFLSNLYKDQGCIYDSRTADNPTYQLLTPKTTFAVDTSLLQTELNAYWLEFKTLESQDQFYEHLQSGQVISKGIVIDSKACVQLESTIFQEEYLHKLYSNHLIVFKGLLPTIKHRLVVSLLNSLDNNYFHWTLETLGRVYLLKDHRDFKQIQWLIKHRPLPFVKASLNFLFDIPEGQMIEKKLFLKVNFEHCYIPSFPHIRDQSTQWTNVYYPKIIKGLNALARQRWREKGSQSNFPDKIVISRKKAIARRLKNEDEVIEALSDKGFSAIILEDLSYTQQVGLFYNAKAVIGLHGAGLSNLLYGKDIKLVELFPADRNPRDAFYFVQIAAALGFAHHQFVYDPVDSYQDCELTAGQISKIRAIF